MTDQNIPAESSATGRPAVLIVGITSAIANGIAAAFAKEQYDLLIAGRDPVELDRIQNDLRIRYRINVKSIEVDLLNFDSHQTFFTEVCESSELAGIVFCAGYMTDQDKCNQDFMTEKTTIDTNFTSAVSICSRFANHFAANGSGFIIGVTSVAGDRGRQSNYTYGASKGAFSLYLQGLRNRLFHDKVHVMTVKPGFVDTAMTWGLPGMFLVASPEQVGRHIVRSLKKKKNTVYTPWFWGGIMLIIRTVPEWLFKRLKL